MGLLDKIKEAAGNSKEEQQTQRDFKTFTEYVHEHIKELNEIFVENEGKLYPIKSALIFGTTKTKDDIEDIIGELDVDDEDVSFKEQLLGAHTPYYIDTEIGRLYVSAGEGAVNLIPKLPFEFYMEKKQRAIKTILDGVNTKANLTSAEVMEKIKYCNAQRIKEDDSRLQEAWDKCITSLIKSMPNPETSDWMNEIKLCNTELSKDSEEMILEAWRERLITLISSKPDPTASEVMTEIKLCYSELKKDADSSVWGAWEERVLHLMDLIELPSAKEAVRTIHEYDRLAKQIASDSRNSGSDSISEEWKKKKEEIVEYAKLYYMDEPSVKQYFEAEANAKNIEKNAKNAENKAKLIEALSHVGCLALVFLFFCVGLTGLAFMLIVAWAVATFIYRKYIRSKYVKPEEDEED